MESILSTVRGGRERERERGKERDIPTQAWGRDTPPVKDGLSGSRSAYAGRWNLGRQLCLVVLLVAASALDRAPFPSLPLSLSLSLSRHGVESIVSIRVCFAQYAREALKSHASSLEINIYLFPVSQPGLRTWAPGPNPTDDRELYRPSELRAIPVNSSNPILFVGRDWNQRGVDYLKAAFI